MKMKRYFAPSMQQALRDVRDDLGPDAVILSNRNVDGGIEIICTLEYSEQMLREALPQEKRRQLSPGKLAEKAVEKHRELEERKEQARVRIDEIKRRHNPPAPEKNTPSVPNIQSTPKPQWEPHRREEAPVERSGFENVHEESVVENSTEKYNRLKRDDLIQTPPETLTPSNFATETMQLLADMRTEISQLKSLVMTQEDKAVDPPGDSKKAMHKEILERLLRMGIFPELSERLLESIRQPTANQISDGKDCWRGVLARLAHDLTVSEKELIDEGGCLALVGPTGVGKTTTVAKLAARYILKYGTEGLALITTDRFRIGGPQQLTAFGKILNAPVWVVSEGQSIDDLLDELSDKRLLLIDTAGLNPQDSNWKIQQQDLQSRSRNIKKYLVLSAVSQPQVMKSTYHYYKMLDLTGCILSKLDEAYSLGEVLSMAILNELAVAYVTDGQKVPDDIQPAKAHSLIVRSVSLWRQSEHQANSLDDLSSGLKEELAV